MSQQGQESTASVAEEAAEVTAGPLKLKGREAFTYLGWVAAVGMAVFSMMGAPQRIFERLAVLETKVASVEQGLKDANGKLDRLSPGELARAWRRAERREREDELASRAERETLP